MTSDRAQTEAREAALRALGQRDRRQPVADLIADEETDSSAGAARRWRFASEDWVIELNLTPTAGGWIATTRVAGESSFVVTVYRTEKGSRPREAAAGEAPLGLLTPGPLSLTYRLGDGREVQTAWTTLPRPPHPVPR